MPTVKLTKRVVEAQRPSDKDVILWDTELKGLGCKITPKGKRVYFCYYRTRNGTQRRPSIGEHRKVTAEQARATARQWLARVAEGGDPSQDRRDARSAPTMSELCERFMTEHAAVRNKAGTVYNYRWMIDRFIIPAVGAHKVPDITRADVDRLHRSLRHTPYQANRVRGLLSKILNIAERWGIRPDGSNPTRHAARAAEQ